MVKRKLKCYKVFSGKKPLGGAVAMNKENALKQVKKVWKGTKYEKKLKIGGICK